jgi:branched-chain amino acid transport system permease protein
VTTFLALTVLGLVFGCVYALTAVGVVVTYTTSGVFNFAHGATGMLAAFAYWQLSEGWGVPVPLALVLVLGVLAPLFGAGLERVLIRPLAGRSADAPLVATLGLLLALVGASYAIWDPQTFRSLPGLFPGHELDLGAITVTYHEIAIVVITVLVGFALRTLFTRTRLGIAMRAVVDNPELAATYGASPQRVAQLSWALGSSLAALAGVLLAPLLNLDVLTMTLVIINAFAAALAGRLKNLPVTVAAAIGLQLVVGYGGHYLPDGLAWRNLLVTVPMIFLFAVVIATRQDRLPTARPQGSSQPRLPGARASWASAAAFVVAAALLATRLEGVWLRNATAGLATAVILLSLVLLVGYGGQVSLCQLTFVGVGAWVMGHTGGGGNLLGVLLAGLAAGAVGVLVALPTLRLRGLYLALATLAFAQAMDGVFFKQAFGANDSLTVPRVDLPGLGTTTDRGFFVLCAAVFALAGVALLAVRRSKYGRRLTALDDSAAACATLGIDVNRGKLAVFGASAFLAGVGGVLYGGSRTAVSSSDFLLLNSLALLLLLLVGGRNRVSGALLSALAFAVLFPWLKDELGRLGDVPGLAELQFLLTGLAVLGVARYPEGLAGQLADLGRRLLPRDDEEEVPRVPVLADALPAGQR